MLSSIGEEYESKSYGFPGDTEHAIVLPEILLVQSQIKRCHSRTSGKNQETKGKKAIWNKAFQIQSL